MVLYFTGTGNSRYVAERIAQALGDTLCSLNDRIKAGDTSPVNSDARLIIVVPTYAWRIPHIVREHLENTAFPGAAQVWFVMTCGGQIGGAGRHNQALAQKMGLAYQGTAQIVMPENYIALFQAPQAEEARQIVAQAEPEIDRAIAALAKSQAFGPTPKHLLNRFLSGPVNPFFYAVIVKDTPFTVSDACNGCGQCVKRCPLNNITLPDGKPLWGGRCTHCMACICYCPTEAIEYGKKSAGKPRYHFEALRPK